MSNDMNDIITTNIHPTGLPDVIEEGGEVRVLDLTLAERLGYEQPRSVRRLIARHRDALSEIAPVVTREGRAGKGQKFEGHYLTEAQAHFVIARSRTKRADVELVFVAQVFTEFRNGNLIAKDDDTQARMDAAEEARRERLAELRRDKEARHRAFKIMNSGRSSRPGRLPRY